MTKEDALYSFWASFGLPAYEENSVPTGQFAPAFPYITFQVSTGSFSETIALTASLWYRSRSWVEANNKADEISRAISSGGTCRSYDDGAIWIRRGTPFSQNMGDESDDAIKRKILNIAVEFLTEN